MITQRNPSSYFLRSHKYNSPYFRYRFHFAFNIYSETNIKRTSSKISKFFKISGKKSDLRRMGKGTRLFASPSQRWNTGGRKAKKTRKMRRAARVIVTSDLKRSVRGGLSCMHALHRVCASVSTPITMALFVLPIHRWNKRSQSLYLYSFLGNGFAKRNRNWKKICVCVSRVISFNSFFFRVKGCRGVVIIYWTLYHLKVLK